MLKTMLKAMLKHTKGNFFNFELEEACRIVEELPDWGGRHFRLLNRPQIALLSHSGFSSYDVGVSWWSLDHHLGIRHSQLDASLVNYGDLRRYNTIILPSGYSNIDSNQLNIISDWVEQGGTLIAHNGSSRYISSNNGIGSVKTVQNTFDEIDNYNMDLQREFLSLDEIFLNAEIVFCSELLSQIICS